MTISNTIYRLFTICLILVVAQSLYSCVARKKLIYLQENTANLTANFPDLEKPKTEFDYQLQPSDVITLHVFSVTASEYNFFASGDNSKAPVDFMIDQEGQIELPAVGKIQLSELTLKEAQEKIKNALDDYLNNPVVQIRLVTPFEFTTLGEVRSQGKQSIEAIQVNILEAIALSGGLSDYADRANIKIVRMNEEGHEKVIKINVLEENLLYSENFYIQSGDIIVVDPLRAKNIRDNQLFAATTLLGAIGGLGILIFNLLK